MNRQVIHKELAEGRWYQMPLMEQLGNIGSEVGRAKIYQEKGDSERLREAIDRALELFDLTLNDRRWIGRLQEIGRARDVFCDAVSGGKEYNSDLASLDRYFMHFAFAAQASRN